MKCNQEIEGHLCIVQEGTRDQERELGGTEHLSAMADGGILELGLIPSWETVKVKATCVGSGARKPGFESQLHHVSSLGPWASHLISLCLILPLQNGDDDSISEGCYRALRKLFCAN